MYGRTRDGTASTTHSANDIAAVACPLGHDAAPGGTTPAVSTDAARGSASSGLRSCVVSLAPSRIAPIVIASHTRRRAMATSTGTAAKNTNGFGLQSCATKIASELTRGWWLRSPNALYIV